MPLTMVQNGENNIIKKAGGNVIANIKDSRIAIGREMANKIIV